MYTNKFKSLKQNLVNTANEGGPWPPWPPPGYATDHATVASCQPTNHKTIIFIFVTGTAEKFKNKNRAQKHTTTQAPNIIFKKHLNYLRLCYINARCAYRILCFSDIQ